MSLEKPGYTSPKSGTSCYSTNWGSMRVLEHGGVIVMFAISLFSLLSLVCFAIAVSRIMAAQITLQNALDAGSMGATYVARSQPADVIEQTAIRIAQDYARANNLTFASDPHPTIITDSITGVVTVELSGQTNVPLPILGLLSANSWSHNVSSSTKTKLNPVSVVLVLDRSGSMGAYVPPSTSVTRLDALQVAANNFVAQFADNLDRFALVSFSTDVTVDMPMGPLHKDDLIDKINDLDVSARTNTPQAMAVAQTQLAAEGARSKIVVLFTDGEPNELLSSPFNFPSACEFRTGEPGAMVQTITIADEMRTSGATVFTIGLGLGTSTYAQAWAPHHFLSRTANQPLTLMDVNGINRFSDDNYDASVEGSNPVLDISDNQNMPEMQPLCVPTYLAIQNKPRGQYYYTQDAEQLNRIFSEIAGQILAKFVR